MGQVWSKADFDGNRELGNQGGRGSCLAVTAQNSGPDGVWDTDDDLVTRLNQKIADISLDSSFGDAADANGDRVRGFYSFHHGGGNFAMGDGSVRFVSETIDVQTYLAISTIDFSEVVDAD